MSSEPTDSRPFIEPPQDGASPPREIADPEPAAPAEGARTGAKPARPARERKAPAKRKATGKATARKRRAPKPAAGKGATAEPQAPQVPQSGAGMEARSLGPAGAPAGAPGEPEPAAGPAPEPTPPEPAPPEPAPPEPAPPEPVPTAPAIPAQSTPPGPDLPPTTLKEAPPWIDAPPLSPLRSLLLRAHRLTFDRSGNRLDRVATAAEIPLRDLHVVGSNRAQAHDYRPTPRRLVAWALDCLDQPLDQATFVDVGSGRGRVLFEAARWPFQRIVGIEFCEELHDDASLNLRHWPRALMACREVDLVLADAVETPLPDGDLVVWIFDPFSERMLTRMAARLAEHARRARVTLVLVDPRNPMAFRESPAFREIAPLPRQRRRLALLSPYPVRIFTAASR